jgi:plastocyanin
MRLSRAVVICAFVAAGCGGGGGGTEAPVVATLDLSPTQIDTLFSRGLTVQLNTVAKDASGNVISRPSLTWSTGSQGIATVNSSGLVTAQGNGKTNITVTSGPVNDAVEVVVRRKIMSITVTPGTRSLAPTETQQLTVQALDALGNVVSGAPAATFASSNDAAATVDGAGRVTAIAIGTTTVTATMVTVDGTRTATSAITVATQSFPAAATVTIGNNFFNPSTVDITMGGTVTWNNTSQTSHDVTFATLAANNIPAHTSGSNARTFNSAGTYQYQCSIHGGAMSGTVIVH